VLAETLVPKLDASVQGSFGWQGEMLDAVSLQGLHTRPTFQYGAQHVLPP